MRLSDWTALCDQEWRSGGEVVAVALTGPSARELAADITGPGRAPAPGGTARLFNPAASSRRVRVTVDAQADAATVRSRSGGGTRTVYLDTAS